MLKTFETRLRSEWNDWVLLTLSKKPVSVAAQQVLIVPPYGLLHHTHRLLSYLHFQIRTLTLTLFLPHMEHFSELSIFLGILKNSWPSAIGNASSTGMTLTYDCICQLLKTRISCYADDALYSLSYDLVSFYTPGASKSILLEHVLRFDARSLHSLQLPRSSKLPSRCFTHGMCSSLTSNSRDALTVPSSILPVSVEIDTKRLQFKY